MKRFQVNADHYHSLYDPAKHPRGMGGRFGTKAGADRQPEVGGKTPARESEHAPIRGLQIKGGIIQGGD